WRRRATEREAEAIRTQAREHEREARLVRKAALAPDVVEIIGAALAEHREHVTQVLIEIVKHWRTEQSELREEVGALRIGVANLRGERDEVRRAADDLRFRTTTTERRH